MAMAWRNRKKTLAWQSKPIGNIPVPWGCAKMFLETGTRRPLTHTGSNVTYGIRQGLAVVAVVVCGASKRKEEVRPSGRHKP